MIPGRSDLLLHSLLENPEFIRWALGESSDQTAYWDHWATSHPDGRNVLHRAIEIVKDIREADHGISDHHIERKISDALRTAKQQEASDKNDSFFPVFLSGWNLAASILIALGLCFSVFRIYQNNTDQKDERSGSAAMPRSAWKQIANTERAFKYVRLPDGSSVVLHKNSVLKYPGVFTGSKREVYLAGEAFFEVTKDPSRPFFVYAGELTTKVHGTSFSIRAVTNDAEITVAVKTGKVSVFREKDPPLLLTCNEQATFERARARLVRSGLKSAVLLNIPIENQSFIYSETPAVDVFDALARAYGVSIDFDRDVMAHCSVTATLGDEPLENKLKWLCTILEANYSVTGDSITIQGNPCQ